MLSCVNHVHRPPAMEAGVTRVVSTFASLRSLACLVTTVFELYTANSIKVVLSKLKTLNSKRTRNDGLSLK